MPALSPSPFTCAPIAAAPCRTRSLDCAAPRKAQG